MNELREEIELPALDVNLDDVRKAEHYADEETGYCDDEREYHVVVEHRQQLNCRERQLKSLWAANREQKAEIERLQAALACKEAEVELTLNRYRELASKRCSCGRSEALATIPAVQGMDK